MALQHQTEEQGMMIGLDRVFDEAPIEPPIELDREPEAVAVAYPIVPVDLGRQRRDRANRRARLAYAERRELEHQRRMDARNTPCPQCLRFPSAERGWSWREVARRENIDTDLCPACWKAAR